MYWDWKPYVSVAERRRQAQQFAKQQAKKLGRPLQPIALSGKKIATTFWGKAWCDHLERLSDYANRLPRGRTYVRNGSVIDIDIAEGQVSAFVSGSEVYKVQIGIQPVKKPLWEQIRTDCARSIDSLFDLLQGRLSNGVMQRLTHPSEGLFPQPKEIKLNCSCPDGAVLCKHVAAVLYGVGSRLDREPQLLFLLRGVDHLQLIAEATKSENLAQSLDGGENTLATGDIGAIFGIELDGSSATGDAAKTPRGKKRAAAKKPAAKVTGATARRKKAQQAKQATSDATVTSKVKTPALAKTKTAAKAKRAARPAADRGVKSPAAKRRAK